MKIGYARVSTNDQNLNSRIDALQSAGCQKIYQGVACGARAERPDLENLLGAVRPGDALVICKLDRLGRSLSHLVTLANKLLEQDVGLVSLNDPVDTSTPQGRLSFNLFAALAEFERETIKERTVSGNFYPSGCLAGSGVILMQSLFGEC